MKKHHLLSLILLMAVSTGCAKIIDAGHRGVKKVWGEVKGPAMTEGFYFYNPISTAIVEISVRERKWPSKTEAYTNDVQNVMVTFALNWSPIPASITDLYKEKGEDYPTVLIPQVVEEEIKKVVAQYKAVDLIEQRGKASDEIKVGIRENLKTKDLIVIDFAITNLQYNKEFDAAVEAKVVAQERAKEEKNRTVQIEEQAKQKIVAAQAEAQSIKIRGNALSRNPSLVQFEAVQKWNGIMPTVMLGKGSTPFIDLSAVMGGKKR